MPNCPRCNSGHGVAPLTNIRALANAALLGILVFSGVVVTLATGGLGGAAAGAVTVGVTALALATAADGDDARAAGATGNGYVGSRTGFCFFQRGDHSTLYYCGYSH